MTFDRDRRHDESDDRGGTDAGQGGKTEAPEAPGPLEDEGDLQGDPGLPGAPTSDPPGGGSTDARDGDELGGGHTKQSDF